MYKLYMKEGVDYHMGYWRETVVVLDRLVVAHIRDWARPGVTENDNVWAYPWEGQDILEMIGLDRGMWPVSNEVDVHMQDWAAQVAEARGVQHWAEVIDWWGRKGIAHEPVSDE